MAYFFRNRLGPAIYRHTSGRYGGLKLVVGSSQQLARYTLFPQNQATPPGHRAMAAPWPITVGVVSGAASGTLAAASASVTEGRVLAGSAVAAMAVQPAALTLVVDLSGIVTVTLTVAPAALAGGANLGGSASAVLTVDTATLGALVALSGSTSATLTGTAALMALGLLSGTSSTATVLERLLAELPQQTAQAVWAETL